MCVSGSIRQDFDLVAATPSTSTTTTTSAPQPAAAAVARTRVPTAIRFPGQPCSRFWEFE